MKCFYFRTVLTFIILGCFPFILTSCGSGNDESAIAKNITFSVSKGALVLNNDLDDLLGQTCVAGGVPGPRVRIRGSIKWSGTEGDLIPFAILISATDQRLLGEMSGTISPGAAGSESLAFMFGRDDDLIPADGIDHPMDSCFLDYGGLPKPRNKVTGSNRLEIPVTLQMIGVARNSAGDDTPFVKEVSTTISYVAGSVSP